MKRLSSHVALAFAALFAAAAFLPRIAADQPTLSMRAQGTLDIGDDGFAVALLRGTAPAMGKFACYGEIDFVPGEQAGSLDGEGVVAFVTANGDVVAAVVEWQIAADGANTVLVHWRDAVTFSDGTTATTTGRFVDHRPPGPIYMKVEG
jgi:hypothetical protein